MTTYVFAHGSYQGGWIWKPLAENLRRLGHTAYAPSLDGCGDRRQALRPGITTESQAGELASLIFHEDLEQVVLVGTSSGGMVVCKTAELIRERVKSLCFISALALLDGEKISDQVRPPQQVTDALSVAPSREDAEQRWAALLPPKERQWALERYSPHPIDVYRRAVDLPRFWSQEWDATVIWCKRSAFPPIEHHRRTTERLGARFHELDAGHLAALSHWKELTPLLPA